jgi:ABC-type transport system substrate-binding protein
MTRRPTWLSAAAVGGAIALMSMSAAPVFAQDGPGEMPAGGWTVYPNYGEVDCEAGTFNGDEYGGQVKKIEAIDDMTVVFDLCAPDPAFLSKIAFSAFGINDADYLAANSENRNILTQPNGTGPYVLDEWREGEEMIFAANPNYWGEAPLTETAVLRWSSEPGQKLIELQSRTVDGIDNPSPDDIPLIESDDGLQVIPREGINVFYLGMNNTIPPFDNPKVREAFAIGIDRDRILNTFYPEGSERADWFTPCQIEFGCEGEAWPEYDPEAAVAMLNEALIEDGFVDADGNAQFPAAAAQIHLRVVDRTYLPFPEQVGLDVQDQLKDTFGILASVVVSDSAVFIPAANAGDLPGFHLLGWNADYPDATNFLDYHFGAGAQPQFGEGWPDIHEALTRGATSAVPEVRQQAYTDANNAIRTNIPMIPVARGASSTAWAADVEGAHSSPLSNELFYVIGGGADGVLVFMQNDQPISLYCMDESDGETLRACEQLHESLYAYEIAGVTPVPSLATECTANDDGTQWTCALREGVTFHDGSTFEAADVVTSYAAQWDTTNPLHVGNSGQYSYFSGLWGGFLNPAAAGTAQ